MKLELKDKVVVITGGGTGIGFACALGFLQEGSKVAICGRGREKLEMAKAAAGGQGFELFTGMADMTNTGAVINFADNVVRRYGKIDVWLNNAGIVIMKPILDLSEAEWDEIMASNIKSVFIGSRVAFAHMKARGGVILNASSFAALIPSAGSGAYAATKSAILSLTRTLAAEFAPFNIRVNAYIPGVVKTEMNQARIVKSEKSLIEQIALHKLSECEDVVPSVLFLASSAARYITGTAIDISGGKFCVQNPHDPWLLK